MLGSALFFLALGMGVPLMVVGGSGGHWLPRAGGWMDTVKAAFGVGLLGVAIWLLAAIACWGGVIAVGGFACRLWCISWCAGIRG